MVKINQKVKEPCMKSKTSYKVSMHTKEAILNSATKIFSKDGYKGATMTDIAKDSKVNKALIYYHYKNKHTLYNEIFQSTILSLRESLAKNSSGTTFLGKSEMISEYLGKKPNFSLLLTKELGSFGENLDEKTVDMIKETISTLSEGSHDRVFALGVFGTIHFLNISQDFFKKSEIVNIDEQISLSFIKSLKKITL
jgi:AcrR family transcriptional regulator